MGYSPWGGKDLDVSEHTHITKYVYYIDISFPDSFPVISCITAQLSQRRELWRWDPVFSRQIGYVSKK